MSTDMIMKLNAEQALICSIALAYVIIGWINIWWQLDESMRKGLLLLCIELFFILFGYMKKRKEDAEQLIQEAEQLIQEAEDLWPYGPEAEDLISWLDQGAEGDGEWNPNRQMTQQIADCDESGDF